MTRKPTKSDAERKLDRLSDEARADRDGPPEIEFTHVEVSLKPEDRVDSDDPPDGDATPEVRGEVGGFRAKYDPATGDVDEADSWGHVARNDDADNGGDE